MSTSTGNGKLTSGKEQRSKMKGKMRVEEGRKVKTHGRATFLNPERRRMQWLDLVRFGIIGHRLVGLP
jgi:hypothetical protein